MVGVVVVVQVLGLGHLRIVPDALIPSVVCAKPHIPVSARLLHFNLLWKRFQPSIWVQRVLDVGYVIPLKRLPSFQGVRQTPLKGQYAQVLLEEVESLLRKGAIEQVFQNPRE